MVYRKGAVQYTDRSSFLVIPPDLSIAKDLEEMWNLALVMPLTTEPICRFPPNVTATPDLLCNIDHPGTYAIRCSVLHIEQINEMSIVLQVTDGTAECLVEVSQECLHLFQLSSLSQLVVISIMCYT